MHAVLQVLVVGVAPLHIHTDYLPLIEGLARGRRWCTAARRGNVDIWSRIWHYIDERGGLDAGPGGAAPSFLLCQGPPARGLGGEAVQ